MNKHIFRFLLIASMLLSGLATLAIGISLFAPWELCLARTSNGQWSIAAGSGRFFLLRIGDNGDTAMTLSRRDRANPPTEGHHFIGTWCDGQFAWEFDFAGLMVARTWYAWRVNPGEASERPCHAVIIPFWWLTVPFIVWGSERWRRSRIQKQGLCLTCCYDLRAHHPGDRCPECGIPVPAQSAIIPPDQRRNL